MTATEPRPLGTGARPRQHLVGVPGVRGRPNDETADRGRDTLDQRPRRPMIPRPSATGGKVAVQKKRLCRVAPRATTANARTKADQTVGLMIWGSSMKRKALSRAGIRRHC